MRRYNIVLEKENQKVIITIDLYLFSVADKFFLYSLRPEKGSFANPLHAKLVLSVAICNRRFRLALNYLFTFGTFISVCT